VRRSEILVGLDLGSSSTKVVVADARDRELPEVLGLGEARSEGIEGGIIVNMEKASAAIRAAVERAEESADVEIGRVSVSLSGEHFKGLDSRGVVAVSSSGGEITGSEVRTVLDAAKTLALPVGRTVVDVLPQEFFVDGQRGIRDPIGMSGVRLGSKVHIVTASEQAVDNTIRAVRKAGLRVRNIVLKPLAAALACLTDDERELGVMSLNLGGGTTSFAIYHGAAVRHASAIGWGASSITNDVALGLRLPLARAEQLKCDHGCAHGGLATDSPIEIPTIGGQPARQCSGDVLAAIIEPRAREIFEMVHGEVGETDYWGRIPAGVVLTGGGARLRGIADVAEDVFGVPARVGVPGGMSGLCDATADPGYAASVGAVLHSVASPSKSRVRREGPVAETVQRVRQWVDSLL